MTIRRAASWMNSRRFFSPTSVLGPLIAALFADKIDNVFVACALLVVLTASAFFWFKKRLEVLEESVKELERQLEEAGLSDKDRLKGQDV